MAFTLVFCAEGPKNRVLHGDRPLKGLDFLDTAGSIMRRAIDGCSAQEHKTFGDIRNYSVRVPENVAIDSGRFENEDVVYVYVCDNWLKQFIFYSAEMRKGRNSRTYPFQCKDTIVITSHVDELAALQAWAELKYPKYIGINPNEPPKGEGEDADVELPEDEISLDTNNQ